MRVLGLDTSTDTGGAALVENGRLTGEYTLRLERTTHSERLLPTVERVLADAGLGDEDKPDGIAVALGPGSFTGLRIGVVTAKAFSFAWQVPVVGVSTLEALAYQMSGTTPFACPVMDARNGNVFTAVYDVRGTVPTPMLAPALRDAEIWFATISERLAVDAGAPIVFGGDGLSTYWPRVRELVGSRAVRVPAGLALLRSGAVALLGAARLARGDEDDAAQLTPVYLRKSEAERKWEARAKKRSLS